MQKKHSQILFISSGTLTIIGAIAQLFEIVYAPYLFSVGAFILIYIQAKYTYDNWNAEIRVQRLARNGLFASLLLAIAAYFMFTHSNLWVLGVLIYALSSLFTSFRGN